MDNYIDNLGDSDDSQWPPKPEGMPPFDQSDDIPEVSPEPEYQEVSPEPEYQEVTPEPEYQEVTPEPESQQPPPQPDVPEGPTKDERLWATFCHLAAFAGMVGVPFGSILGPLVVWLIKREESPFIDENGRKALNFQISLFIYIIVATPLLCLPPVYILAVICLAVVDAIFTVIASINANKGEKVSYPMSIEFIK